MWSTLRQPRWILLTAVVPIGIILCLLGAQWQYQRHVERSARDAFVRGNSEVATAALTDAVSPGQPLASEDEYRTVVASGTYESEGTVLVRRRVFDGSPGFWLVSPLRTDDGATIQVLRGWLPLSADTSSQALAPPGGPVTVNGWLAESEVLPDPVPTDLPPNQVSALDTAALSGGQAAYVPYLVAQSTTPTDPAPVRTVAVPAPGLGPHLAYSWQWLFFAALFPIGWVVLLRRELRDNRERTTDPKGDSPTPVGGGSNGR